ncbi:hypothetical protein H5410_061195 [Solanum commersonii]|uniref:Uncharacterized protein n=1 Tax=Solanum commersonii TaxID=4109 RepID=A0A9J5W733_SOLCO|nr:hypothetical protein H5410_061195 [Solanum commersonii]
METLTSTFQRLWAKGLLKPREVPLNNNFNPPTMNTTIVQEDPIEIYSKHLTRKRKSHQRN